MGRCGLYDIIPNLNRCLHIKNHINQEKTTKVLTGHKVRAQNNKQANRMVWFGEAKKTANLGCSAAMKTSPNWLDFPAIALAVSWRVETWFYQGWHNGRRNSGVASNFMTGAKVGWIVWIDLSAYRAGQPFWPARIRCMWPSRAPMSAPDARKRHVAS